MLTMCVNSKVCLFLSYLEFKTGFFGFFFLNIGLMIFLGSLEML